MALKELIPVIVEDIKQHKEILGLNRKLFEIYEGQLLDKVKDRIRAEFSIDTARDAMNRLAPINILQRVVAKLAQIYQPGPARRVVDGTDSDQELLEWYEEQFNVDVVMNNSNELFNFSKNSLIEPFINDGKPMLRVIPSHNFWVYSRNPTVPTDPTEVVTFSNDQRREDDMVSEVHVYSDMEFLITDTNGNVNVQKMMALGNPGVNPFGALPFVYVNASSHLLIPLPDVDMLSMATLVPLLLTDLNYAVKYQSFATTYGIDLDVGSLRKAPNAFWDLTSKVPGEGSPQIGSIKPEVDIDQVLNLIASEIAMWLNTKGLRPAALGNMDSQNFASGVSKLIDEADVTENRRKQVAIYESAEKQLWDLVLKTMHPFWVQNGMIENRTLFSPNATVKTDFTTPVPMVRRGDLIAELKAEVDAGFTTAKRAIKALNPRMSEDEIEELVLEIEQDRPRLPMPADEDEDGTTEG